MESKCIYEAKRTDAALFAAKGISLSILIMLFLVSASAADSDDIGVAAHTATVTIAPALTYCGASNNFTVNVTNNGPNAVKIIEIYNDSYGGVIPSPPPHTNFVCGPAPAGWVLNDLHPSGIPFCQYLAVPANFLNASMSQAFTFSATITNESNYSWGVATRDINETWIPHYPKTIVDCTPPNTTKSFEGPQYPEDNDWWGTPHWISSLTNVILTALDPEPHPSGVNATYWRNTLVDDYYCYNPQSCAQAQASAILFEDSFNSSNPLNTGWTGSYPQPPSSSNLTGDISTTNSTPPAYSGYSAIIDDDAAMRRVISTTGYKDINFSYCRRTYLAESLDRLKIGWKVGDPTNTWTDWTELESIQSNAWSCVGFTLPPSANNKSKISIAFFLDNDDGDYGVVDNVVLKGSAIGSNLYTGPFNKSEESCHLIEYYSTDNVSNTEPVKKQCVFVDNTPPITNKTIGEPKLIKKNITGVVCENQTNGGDLNLTNAGKYVATVNFSTKCPSGVGVGIAYDGQNLWYSCTSGTDLYRANPFTGAVTASYDIVPSGGLGALSYDATRNAIWAGYADSGRKVRLLQLDSTKDVINITEAFTAQAVGIALDDGLAYDAGDDTIYVSPDISPTIYQYHLNGTLIKSFAKVPGSACGNSGLALGGSLMYEGFDGCSKVIVVNKTSTSVPVFNFSTTQAEDPAFRDEDLECDTNTFASIGKHVMWSVEAYDTNFGAGYGQRRALAFEIPFGSCGIGGKPACEENVTTTVYITNTTPINLTCSDQGKHPVDHSNISYRYRFSEDCADLPGASWTQWFDPNGYDPVTKTIYFPEDSCHELEYFCRDALGNEEKHQFEIDIVDSKPPIITKTIIGPQIGDCPPEDEGDKCYIMDHNTTIEVNASDPEPHPVGGVKCDWSYELDGVPQPGGGSNLTPPFNITFPEDSTHNLTIKCRDALNNTAVDNEIFLVDSIPPETIKTYGEPFVAWWYPKGCYDGDGYGPQAVGIECGGGPGCQPQCGWADWINSSTLVTLDASDNKVGVNKTYWRNLLVNDTGAAEKICGFPQAFCDPGYYGQYVNLSTPWNEYLGPFQKPEESCHVIEYYSNDSLGNTEPVKWQCVFVDNTPPELNKTIGDPKVAGKINITKKVPCEDGNGDNGNGAEPESFAAASSSDRSQYYEEYSAGSKVSVANGNPCDNATQADKCAYVASTSLPPFVKDTIISEGGNETALNESCGNVLILSSGNPLDNDTTLSTGMGNPGCGANPDGFVTNDCEILNEFMPQSDSVVLAVSSEWPEFVGSTFTDWMQIFSGNISVNISINDWITANIIPYGPASSGTKTLATVSSSSSVNLRVADSGDSIYDTALIVAPESCFANISTPALCGDGIVQQLLGEECDDGNTVSGDGCSSTCKKENITLCDKTVEVNATFITTKTPINLTCKDVLPHPVDHVNISYRYRVSDDCKTWGNWTDWIDPEDPYLATKTIYFQNDSCHELEYYCKDGLGNSGPVQSEIDIVDTKPPFINKTIIGPVYVNSTKTYIDGVTNISVNATDQEPHPVDNVTCDWDYEVIGGNKTGQGQSGIAPPFIVHFPEESKHVLNITCKDKLNNTVKDVQTYYVDKTPPETNKTYGQPFYTNGTSDWINNKTDVNLSAYDAGPHKSGINATYWRNTLVDDANCRNETLCENATGSGTWNIYTGTFHKSAESCHLIEYYSTDNVNKTEKVKKQCVFVDNTPPAPNKTVGKPSEMWNGSDAEFYNISGKCWNGKSDQIECWKVTTLTPITMSCIDPEPHPVDRSIIAFNVNFDGSDATDKYCTEWNGTIGQDGFCELQQEAPVTLYFNETSEHNLQFYCRDALGNKGPVDEEKFKVDGTAFNITINKKWNLISVPFVLLNDSMHKVFDPQSGKIKSVWTYDAVLNQWFVFTPDGIDNDNMNTMLPGWGYWVIANNDTSLLIGGSLFSPAKTPPSKQIVQGWNLIGYWGTEGLSGYNGPNGNGLTAYCELNSVGKTVWDIKIGSLWSYWEPFNPNQWIPYTRYSHMDPGAGYWLFTNQAGEFVVPTDCASTPLTY